MNRPSPGFPLHGCRARMLATTRLKARALALALTTLLAVSALRPTIAAAHEFVGAEQGAGHQSRFLRIELLSGAVETRPVVGGELDLVMLEFLSGSWLAGLTGANIYDLERDPDMWTDEMPLVHIGCTVWQRPTKTAFVYAMLPDVFVGVQKSLSSLKTGRAFVRAEADIFGLGAGVEAGFIVLPDWFTPGRYRTGPRSYEFNLIVFNIGL